MMRTRREPLIYSAKFIELVLKAYPDSKEIKNLLDANEYFLGRYLDDSSNGCERSVPIEKIKELMESGKNDELLRLVKECEVYNTNLKLRIEAYNRWGKEVFLD